MMTEVFTGPPIITNPPTNQLITPSDRATLICTANASGIITYQWQKFSNGSWMDINNSNITNYRTEKLKESRQFRCVVSNEAGETTSSVTINVLSEDTHHVCDQAHKINHEGTHYTLSHYCIFLAFCKSY